MQVAIVFNDLINTQTILANKTLIGSYKSIMQLQMTWNTVYSHGSFCAYLFFRLDGFSSH